MIMKTCSKCGEENSSDLRHKYYENNKDEISSIYNRVLSCKEIDKLIGKGTLVSF